MPPVRPDPVPASVQTLLAAAGPLPAADDRAVRVVAHEHPFPGEGLVGPELLAWSRERLAERLPARDGSAWLPATSARLFEARQLDDPHAMARMIALFLPTSTVQIDAKAYRVARWYPTPEGSQPVFVLRPERLKRVHGSLADLLQGGTRPSVTLPCPPLLDPEVLLPRVRWIPELLLGGAVTPDALADLPDLATWARERPHLPRLPHLQAYWAAHHLLLGADDLAAEVLAIADDRYPPIPELRALARAFADGIEPRQLVDPGVVHDLRATLLDQRPHALPPDMVPVVQARRRDRRRDEATLSAAHDALAARRDPRARRAVEAWGLLQRCAGQLATAEPQLIDAWHPEGAARDALHRRLRTGEYSPLEVPLRTLATLADRSWLRAAEVAFRLGAPYDEDHPLARPGSLVLWGAALGSFPDLMRGFHALGSSAGRRRFLELAIAADQLGGDDAVAFLETEARDFASELGGWGHATTGFAFFALLRRRHPEAVRLADALLRRGPMNDATGALLDAVVDVAASEHLTELLPALVALRRRGFGIGTPRRPHLEKVCAALEGEAP